MIGSSFDVAWFSSLSCEHLCVFGLHGAIYILFFFIRLHFLSFSELSLVGMARDLVD